MSRGNIERFKQNREKKAKQLGMPFGTACNRLRKELLFKLAKLCGLDTCGRCGERIEKADDLSIDHKIDWLDTDPDLFWDLDNIQFSHKTCNRKARKYGRMAEWEKCNALEKRQV